MRAASVPDRLDDSLENDDESRLLERLNARAFTDPSIERWMRHHTAVAHRYVRGWVPNADVDDVVQDFWIRFLAIENAHWANMNHVYAVSKTIIRQVLIDRLRHFRASKRGGNASEVQIDKLNLPATNSSPLEKVIARDALDRYFKALKNLSKRDQALIIGRFELGLDHRSLAERQSLPTVGAARVAVLRAWERLTAQLDEQEKKVV